MAVLKCKMCGGELSYEPDTTVCECEYCGSKQTIPLVDDKKKLTLYERANRLRFNCEFDKATSVYENIVADFPEEAEAYWGLVLCKYGIEYVDDPITAKKVPTCHRSSFDSVMDDADFEMVMENADGISRKVYREEAKQIEEIRRGIIEVSGKEEPYDIFICYKETDENGERTLDSVLAQDVYEALTDKGYRVFFSRITLEDKLGVEYEPYIFAALNSAKVMLVFGTNYDYYNAVWVKNEWSRYLKLMVNDKTKNLIPCYKDIDAYDIPKEFAKLQAQDLGKLGAVQDLVRGIEKLIHKKSDNDIQKVSETVVVQGGKSQEALLKRGNMALEDNDWEKAEQYFDQVLDMDAECGEAYWGLTLAASRCTTKEEFSEYYIINDEKNIKHFNRAKQFGDDKFRDYAEQLKLKCHEKKRERELEKQEKERIKELKCAETRQKIKKMYDRIQSQEIIQNIISTGFGCTLGVKLDGRVVVAGDNKYGKCDVSDWRDIVAVSCGSFHTIGLKKDGRVVAAGDNEYGKCDVSAWKDIVAVCCGFRYTIGLKGDGRVVAAGYNTYGECDVSSWEDIVAVSCGSFHTIGLRRDGRVVATGSNKNGECDVSDWRDITAICCSRDHTIGLGRDGRVVATGSNKNGECDVSSWQDIVAVCCEDSYTIGLKKDGRVVATGSNKNGECDVSSWEDIVAVYCGEGYTIGLKLDGTVVTTGDNTYGQCDVSEWKLFNDIENIIERAERKVAYDAEVKKIKNSINIELAAQKKKITSSYLTQKEITIAEMNEKVNEICQKKKILENKKNELEKQRASLGIFKGKEKKGLTEQIEEISSQISSLQGENTIREQYQERIHILEANEKKEFEEFECTIKEKYPIPSIDIFSV